MARSQISLNDSDQPTVAETGLNIEQYYAAHAANYDLQRFGGSYGQYLDHQERTLLKKWLSGHTRILDLGCGTGRFLELATEGLDRSPEMLAVAQTKYPLRRLVRALSSQVPFPDNSFEAIFSMHLFMHLSKWEISQTLLECERLLSPGGTLIFDVPSTPRRIMTKFQPTSWHCQTAYSPEELRETCHRWIWRELCGLLAFPIHRFSNRLRLILLPFDTAIGHSPLRRWCSYYLVCLEKPHQ